MANEETDLKRTPLYPYYQEKNVKLVDFGSWALPIQFSKLSDEHQVVREQVGLFDVSHMGEIKVSGKRATEWLNKLITNDVSQTDTNQAVYTLVTKEDGGILDDIIIFKLSESEYLLTPNASNTTKIWQWLNKHKEAEIDLENASAATGLIAIQGPKAKDVVAEVFGKEALDIKNYHFLSNVSTENFSDVLLSRTGYTGEDGYECYVKWDQTEALWKTFLAVGEAYNIKECGLGARDTLRLEAGMPLYGHDLSEDVTPLEAGLRFAVKWDKPEPFIGQKALEDQNETGTTYLTRGFEILGRGIAREGHTVFNKEDEEIGVVTSGTQSPTLGKSIGFMRIKKAGIKLGDTVKIQIRKNKVDAKITKKNFLKK
ncbi:glycine cleavage system aminomethyltransferase GcvT [Alkalibacterium sp. 20]|uniref:glycine cleavage system aminomethyltransferase GcvT n=1 Tax=Alkalibacterium sp. 20 TaxID=1798803 RepID=UPI0009000BFD|nr:glycine cleavage system aminomethyltransferase GcvT [Alkalibacterium sp. 20]OJF92591.1 glycine cleavage system protein T [Alkalibacterium sp. 20]